MSESHEKQFTGWWIPSHVVSLLEEGKLNAKEVILLAMIDSYSVHGKGCFASNESLGKEIRVGADRVGRMVSKLKALCLIEQTGFDGRRRTLISYWSKTPGYDPRKSRGRLGENTEADSTKTPGIYNKVNSLHQKGCKGGAKEGSSNQKKTRVQPSNFDQKCTVKLHRIISTVMKVNGRANLKDWANQFRLMRERDGISKKDIKEAIVWYSKHIGQEYQPEAYSAKAFREKFKSGQIPAAMRRSKRDDGEDVETVTIEERVRGTYLRARPEDHALPMRSWDQQLLATIRKELRVKG